MKKLNNLEIAHLLRSVAAAKTLKKANMFEIRAYENAASSIEHLTAELQDLWEEGRLSEVSGVGKGLQGYLDELFKVGKVKHFDELLGSFKGVVFELLDIPGVGPKTALELAELGIKDIEDLENQIKNGKLVEKGFSAKIAEKIISGLQQRPSKDGRMLLPFAASQAEKILEYLKNIKGVKAADPLGSLRRQVATIGDLDFAASSDNPQEVIEEFIKMPGVSKVLGKGENQPKAGRLASKATLVLNSGLHVDLLVGIPENYGALLQHFTGSKNHNIHLRTLAEKRGLSLSEYGIKRKDGSIVHCKTEEEFYKTLGMATPEPELREDTGEIEAGISKKLPDLIEFKDIKGDLHLHSNFPLEPSHGPGADSIEDIVKEAKRRGYEFVGISDHPPGFTTHSKEEIIKILKKRTEFIQNIKQGTKSIRVLNGLEIDILTDGSLSVPEESLKDLDYCIAGIHSGHRGNKAELTNRILTALESPYVNIISHPTGRLINERNSYDADWEKIFEYCAKHKKLLEINAYPNRLDLRDDLVKLSLSYGVKFIINSDAHAVEQMENIPYGVSVARRGWAEKKDIVNAWKWKDFADWFGIK